ncbi:hypothetical protein L7F22_037652 [Adiantum nelumboides]|nr:hypothetical protein [Adiantum nelumboides]
MGWAFAYDDITDDAQKGLGGVLPAAKEFLKDLDQQLVQPPMNGRGRTDALQRHHVIAGTIDVGPAWWDKMRNHLSPAYQALFRYNLRLFTTGAATQIAWR